MVTPITSLFRKDCDYIPAAKVKAYTDLQLDPENPTGVILDTSWGETHLDLKDIIKTGETITRLYLAPETGDPEGLCYEKEDGTTDYISGDSLSRVISLRLLKDVDQESTLENGDAYVYNGNTDLFVPFALMQFVNETNLTLGRLQAQITNLQNQINALDAKIDNEIARAQAAEQALGDRLTAIESAIYNWSSDKTTKIARGNINVTSGGPTSGNGIYTRTPNINNDIDFQ